MTPQGYEPLSGRAKWAQRGLIAVAVLSVTMLVTDYFEYALYGQDVITQHEANANDVRQTLVAFLSFVALVFTAVMFIRWFKRAYTNLQALGVTKLRFAPGWAIWSWFVPFLGLYRPKQIANDIWRGSDPSAPAEHRVGEWTKRSVPALFQWWWGVYLITSFIDKIAFRIYWTANDVSSRHAFAGAAMLDDGFNLIGAVLAVLVVRSATARQEERAARLAAAPDVIS